MLSSGKIIQRKDAVVFKFDGFLFLYAMIKQELLNLEVNS